MKKYRVTISDMARLELLDVARHIKRDNPARSVSYVDELLRRCRSLQSFPERHALISDPKSRGIRRVVHGNHLIFFRLEDSTVHILHVMNGARDYEQLLFPDDER